MAALEDKGTAVPLANVQGELTMLTPSEFCKENWDKHRGLHRRFPTCEEDQGGGEPCMEDQMH